MVLSGTVHLGLVPAHWGEDVLTANLFVLDALAYGLVAIWAFTGRGWRGPGLALLTVNLVAYALYLLGGRESLDPIGVATKLVEITAVVLVFAGRPRRKLPIGKRFDSHKEAVV
jgi:peptidoglycan/LPS O-acetylase OafA/YrhL